MQTVRTAIIGYGLGGAVFHAPLVAATPGMVVAGIVTTDPARQQHARAHYPAAQILTDAEAIWAQPEHFDLVVVTTPNRWHVPFGLAALRAGVPVVIDKPLALTVSEVQDLIDLSQATGKPVIPFQNRRWDGDFLTIRRLLQEDWLGQITRFESHFDRYRPVPRGAWRDDGDPQIGGGLLFDLGSHLVDQALHLFGMPQRVYAELPHQRPGTQVDDDSFIALTWEHGLVAHLAFSQVARIVGPRFSIRGLRGTYVKYGLDPQEQALQEGARPGMPHWGEEARDHWGTLVTERDSLVFDGRIETFPGAYESFYQGVYDTLQAGAPPPVALSEAMQTQRVLAAAQQSAQEQQVISIHAI
jgi:scyllo-inositol 2-dehydrogenase (NADP+)